jgi:geranylgeranyl diphosphate synthase, type II
MIENELKRHLEIKLKVTPSNLAESIRYSVFSGGKRIRPKLTLAMAEMLELPKDQALLVGTAIEFVHCFTLIHDDLPCMDDDDLRRGKPSNHKIFGEAIALLAGTSLLNIAHEIFFELLEKTSLENFKKSASRFYLATGPSGVMGGQAAELLLERDSSLAELEKMHQLKTGALFEASLLIPMDLAGIQDDSPEGKALQTFAQSVGLAFQTADDLEDAHQDSEKVTPTSILHYRTAAEALQLSQSMLRQSAQRVQEIWPQTSAPLLKLNEKISRKLTLAVDSES